MLFGFDKANLRPQARLNWTRSSPRSSSMAPTCKAWSLKATDYLGSDKYNQKLSESRATTVKSYFVANGIPADKVTAVGKGETETKMTETCKAKEAVLRQAEGLPGAGSSRGSGNHRRASPVIPPASCKNPAPVAGFLCPLSTPRACRLPPSG